MGIYNVPRFWVQTSTCAIGMHQALSLPSLNIGLGTRLQWHKQCALPSLPNHSQSWWVVLEITYSSVCKMCASVVLSWYKAVIRQNSRVMESMGSPGMVLTFSRMPLTVTTWYWQYEVCKTMHPSLIVQKYPWYIDMLAWQPFGVE